MIQVMGTVRMKDLPTFVSVFATRGLAMRRKHGCQAGHLYKVLGTEDRVMVLFDWESREAFEGFLADPMVKETMKSGGTVEPPQFTFLEKVADFPG